MATRAFAREPDLLRTVYQSHRGTRTASSSPAKAAMGRVSERDHLHMGQSGCRSPWYRRLAASRWPRNALPVGHASGPTRRNGYELLDAGIYAGSAHRGTHLRPHPRMVDAIAAAYFNARSRRSSHVQRSAWYGGRLLDPQTVRAA